ncbi:MAG: hypothetical protein AABY18_00260 [Candidatus Thermoplasmatota archaeon]
MAETDKAQFRTDPKLIAAVRARGLNPNDVARKAFEEEANRILGDDFLARLRQLQKGFAPWPKGGMARAVRESRDDH